MTHRLAIVGTREPFVVVASVIINADKEWKAITRRIREMADRLVPEDKKKIFKNFHAMRVAVYSKETKLI
jgi:hypothetical protein